MSARFVSCVNTRYLEPIDASTAWFVVACIALQHLHHKAFAAVLDTLLQECLDLVRSLAIRGLRKVELSGDLLEVFPEELSSLMK